MTKCFWIFALSCLFLSSCSSPKWGRYKHVSKEERIAHHKHHYIDRKESYWPNHHLDDINYDILIRNNLKTSVSFVAIGEKIKTKNQPYIHDNNDLIITRATKCKNGLGAPWSMVTDNRPKSEDCITTQAIVKKEKKYTITGKSIILKSTTFSKLSGWNDDNFSHAIESFLMSCGRFMNSRKQNVSTNDISLGSMDDWRKICNATMPYREFGIPKEFFEKNFIPFLVTDQSGSSTGKFTGYYEFSISGSKVKTNKYRYGIYRIPPDCQKKKKCPTRDEINRGAISDKFALYWVDDYIDLMNLQTQGSGIIDFEDGTYARVNFGGSNHKKYRRFWDYFAINKVLPPKMSKNTIVIRKFLKENPSEAMRAIGYNPSYTFFVPMDRNNGSPPGAQCVPLTPTRSIAVDDRYIPYGIPVWISTKLAIKDKNTRRWLDFNRLTVAQDTGSAIKGIIRADVFFGHGIKARFVADNMKFSGSYYLLIPKIVVHKMQRS